MHRVYNSFINLSGVVLKTAGFFSGKLKKFTNGRKNLFENLESQIERNSKRIWIHAASLGEFEMGVPVLKILKDDYPNHQIIVSFFSPSGFENKRSHPLVDIFTYLPLDTKNNARRFIKMINPEMAIFIKYDFWPNFLTELKKHNIRTFLVSGVFREDQLFFKSYGKWMRQSLKAFEHFFVQDQNSAELLKKMDFDNVTVAGDNRFDRVAAQLEIDNKIDFIERFKQDKLLIVFGSSWPEDEELYLDFINESSGIKFLIAPHEIKRDQIHNLRTRIQKKVSTYTGKEDLPIQDVEVFIMDTIGFLGKAYSYANIAYVGGAAGNTGLHNILEPATFGIPIITGKNIQKFPEAIKLQKLAGLYTVDSKEEFSEIAEKLVSNENFRRKTGMISGHFINSNTGATRLFQQYLTK